jgi:hypothetical protein
VIPVGIGQWNLITRAIVVAQRFTRNDLRQRSCSRSPLSGDRRVPV